MSVDALRIFRVAKYGGRTAMSSPKQSPWDEHLFLSLHTGLGGGANG